MQRTRRWVPRASALLAASIAVVNLVSALTPNGDWGARLLLSFEPVEAVPLFHALALPTSGGLLLAAYYLSRRRARAWLAAVVFLFVLGALDLLKGFDVEEAALSWTGAALLAWGKPAFPVRSVPGSIRSAVRVTVVAGATTVLLTAAIVVGAAPHAGGALIAREALDLLTWQPGPLRFSDELGRLPLGIGVLSGGVLALGAALAFRPLAAVGRQPDPTARTAAADLVRAHGHDTLAFFKLRHDADYHFSPDGRAFAAYRLVNGVLLVSGDPVGPPDALPGLVRSLAAFAEIRGLKLAALGAGASLLPLWREAGLRSFYLGDEAVVETGAFSLHGRPIRKVRQAVARAERAGYTANFEPVASLAPAALAELERLSAAWLAGAPERGFTMAMDSLAGGHASESAVVVARDAGGRARGFIHLVPSFGRPAMSLSAMRRDRDTPNGLMEFLVVRMLELLRDRGVEEVSLNFAAFARAMHAPASRIEGALGRAAAVLNPYFQIESLYRFNAKFSPSWVPRYLVCESVLALPRVSLAALRAEGQLPAVRLRARPLVHAGHPRA